MTDELANGGRTNLSDGISMYRRAIGTRPTTPTLRRDGPLGRGACHNNRERKWRHVAKELGLLTELPPAGQN